MFLAEIVFLLLVICGAIMLVQGTRRIPVQYAKRVVGNKQYGGARQYIPLKVNAANVMPIIFAQALMFIPALFSGTAFAAAFSSMTGFWYNFTLAVLVIAFTYFYTAIIINPQMMADDMKRNGGFIPGVKPGKQTVNYIDTIMTRITLPGSFFLAIVAILPALAMKFLGIQQAFAYFYGGTSLLIMVGVVLDTLKQIESYLLDAQELHRQRGQDRHDGQEERAGERDTRHDGVDVVHGLLTRFHSRDKAAVSLHVIGHHLRVDDNRRVEVGEGDYQHCKREVVPETGHRAESSREGRTGEQRRDKHQSLREDDRHHIRSIYFQWNILTCTSILFVSNNSFSILHRYSASSLYQHNSPANNK
jgi:hypothetical protein